MTKNITINTIIANAAREAGIRENEMYTVQIVNAEDNICELMLTTEWNRIDCYADIDTGEILGVMATPKTTDEIIGSIYDTVDLHKTA